MPSFTVSYRIPDDAYLQARAQILAAGRKRVKAGKPVGSVRSPKPHLMLFQSLLFFVLAGVFWGLRLWSRPLASAGMIVFCNVMAIFMLACGGLWLLVWLLDHLANRALLKLPTSGADGGILYFDDSGIRDADNRGHELKCLWAEYDCCLLTEELIVLCFTRHILYGGYDPQTAQAICDALQAFGQGSTVFYANQK